MQNTRKSACAADYTEDLRIKKWLGPADASINYTNAFASHHKNTGRWFLKGPRYECFRTTPYARLWLRGIPGCGKTVLASTIINDLQEDSGTSTSTVIYFFFSFADELKQRVDHMLRSLILQLCELHQTAENQLMDLFKRHNDGKKPIHREALQEVFDQMMETVQDVTIVLDALDESSGKHDLLNWITSPSNQHFKFVVTSRSEKEIGQSLAAWLPADCVVTLEDEPVGDDIEAYVHDRLETEKNLSCWLSMHDLISEALVKKAGGMYAPYSPYHIPS